MEQVQGGDQYAFHSLFEEIKPIISRYVRRRVSDQSEADDICQEALIAIFRSRHTYLPSRPFDPWLFAIVRNVFSRSFGRTLERGKWEESVADLPEARGDALVDSNIELLDAFKALPPAQQEAVRLTKLEGLSINEASEVAGSSVAAMKVRVHRAYQALKEALRR